MPKPVVVVKVPMSAIRVSEFTTYIRDTFESAGWGCLIIQHMDSDVKFDIISVTDAEIKSFEELKKSVENSFGVMARDLDI